MFFWASPSCAFRTSQIHQVGLLELSCGVKHEYFESILILVMVMVMLRCGLPHEALDQTSTRI